MPKKDMPPSLKTRIDSLELTLTSLKEAVEGLAAALGHLKSVVDA